jgi:hypothetical protein
VPTLAVGFVMHGSFSASVVVTSDLMYGVVVRAVDERLRDPRTRLDYLN